MPRPPGTSEENVRRELSRFHGTEQDTAGDGFFASFDGPARAIRCAEAIIDGLKPLGLETRVGIHAGECELHEGNFAGIAVVIGARISPSPEQERSWSPPRCATWSLGRGWYWPSADRIS